jgi:hypothetical protein
MQFSHRVIYFALGYRTIVRMVTVGGDYKLAGNPNKRVAPSGLERATFYMYRLHGHSSVIKA